MEIWGTQEGRRLLPLPIASLRRVDAGQALDLEARKGGTTPISCHIVPLLLSVPQPSAGELPHLLVTGVRVWMVIFPAELCLGLQSPVEPNLLGFCYPRRLLLVVFYCSFVSQSPKLIIRIFKTSVQGRALSLWLPALQRESTI